MRRDVRVFVARLQYHLGFDLPSQRGQRYGRSGRASCVFATRWKLHSAVPGGRQGRDRMRPRRSARRTASADANSRHNAALRHRRDRTRGESVSGSVGCGTLRAWRRYPDHRQPVVPGLVHLCRRRSTDRVFGDRATDRQALGVRSAPDQPQPAEWRDHDGQCRSGEPGFRQRRRCEARLAFRRARHHWLRARASLAR